MSTLMALRKQKPFRIVRTEPMRFDDAPVEASLTFLDALVGLLAVVISVAAIVLMVLDGQ